MFDFIQILSITLFKNAVKRPVLPHTYINQQSVNKNILSLTGLLSGKFLKLVLIAFLIASPIAWYIMNNWLEGFTYRIQIPWWSFVLTALISILITALAVGYQTVKAAFANPVDSLRDEWSKTSNFTFQEFFFFNQFIVVENTSYNRYEWQNNWLANAYPERMKDF